MVECKVKNCIKATYKLGFCISHFNEIPSTFDKLLYEGRNPCLKICDTHGEFMSGSIKGSCPICNPYTRIHQCENCKKEYVDQRRSDTIKTSLYFICDDCFYQLQGNGKTVFYCKEHGFYRGNNTWGVICETCLKNKEKEEDKKFIRNIPNEIFVELNSSFRKDNIPNAIYLLTCKEHGEFMSDHNLWGKCPTCKIQPKTRIQGLLQLNNICEIHKKENKSYNGICLSCIIDKLRLFEDFWMPPEFKSIRTGRISLESWMGSKVLFEEILLKECDDKPWFVYIKYFECENGILPIVCGKTGTKLAIKESDLDFGLTQNSIKNKTPARIKILENGWKWHVQNISVKFFETEKEALNCEKFIIKKYGLLGS